MKTSLISEAEILLLCARRTLDPAEKACVSDIARGHIDWGRLTELAGSHGLTPLLYHNLNEIDPGLVPRPFIDRLWCASELIARRNRALAAELGELLRLFEESGIRVLPFKGPMLALNLFGDPALREYGDLDILVPPGEILRATDLIEAHGYEPAYRVGRARLERMLGELMRYAPQHFHRGKGVTVELHWATGNRLFDLPGIDEAWWECRKWGQTYFPSENNISPRLHSRVRTLSPEELVYLTCLHGTKHQWARLAWLCDLAEAVRQHPAVEWRQVVGIAEGQGTLRVLLLGLELARSLLQAPLHEEVLRRIAADPGVSAMAARIVRRLGLGDGPPLSSADKIAFSLAWYRYWPPYLGFILSMAFIPNMVDWSRWDLPPALSFLYYPLHFWRLFLKWGLRPDRKFLDD